MVQKGLRFRHRRKRAEDALSCRRVRQLRQRSCRPRPFARGIDRRLARRRPSGRYAAPSRRSACAHRPTASRLVTKAATETGRRAALLQDRQRSCGGRRVLRSDGLALGPPAGWVRSGLFRTCQPAGSLAVVWLERGARQQALEIRHARHGCLRAGKGLVMAAVMIGVEAQGLAPCGGDQRGGRITG